MKQYQTTTFVLTDDSDDVFLTTSHETSPDPSITIHTAEVYSSLYLHITQEQAEDLIRKLQKSIINLEAEKRKRAKEV